MLENILVVFLVIIIILFFIDNNKNNDNDNIDTVFIDNEPDLTNCQQYYNNIGILTSCSIQHRFDVKSKECLHYYFTDCGERPNPTLETNAEILCKPYYDKLSNIYAFPRENCWEYLFCGSDFLYSSCAGDRLYSIPKLDCDHKELVDCGSRNNNRILKSK
ncbi:PrGVORF64 [Pieris rapae granulovirus Wuhan]|uniref:PrGVORF64 n=1 Tax=Pieris rapae granulovirus Wuhan TaxID=2848030 RepID=D2J4N1_9BBAC|nr:PrGVORF64 [Betabaculovirus arrapae]ACZ63550.1 PrGVORF64 [Betabaculovirus arrapae]AGS18824.1 ORF64 [Pieris rapae granulovirus]